MTEKCQVTVAAPPLKKHTRVTCSIHGALYDGQVCFWRNCGKDRWRYRVTNSSEISSCEITVSTLGSGFVDNIYCRTHGAEDIWDSDHYRETGRCLYISPEEQDQLEASKYFHTSIYFSGDNEPGNAEISSGEGRVKIAVYAEEDSRPRGGLFPPHIARNIAAAILTAAEDAERQAAAIQKKQAAA